MLIWNMIRDFIFAKVPYFDFSYCNDFMYKYKYQERVKKMQVSPPPITVIFLTIHHHTAKQPSCLATAISLTNCNKFYNSCLGNLGHSREKISLFFIFQTDFSYEVCFQHIRRCFFTCCSQDILSPKRRLCIIMQKSVIIIC